MSVTRRAFFSGTLVTAALVSAVLAVVFVVGGLIEDATDGWGLNGYYFRFAWLWQSGPATAGLVYFLVCLLLFLFGFAGATVYKRFGALGVTVSGIGAAVLAVATGAALTWTQSWAFVWTSLATEGPLGMALWIGSACLVLGAGSWLLLRRATP